MKPVKLAIAIAIVMSSSAAEAAWSGPGFYVWAPSSTDWDSTKVIWSGRFGDLDPCTQAALKLNGQLDRASAADAMFLFECHRLDQEVRSVTPDEMAAVKRVLFKH